MINTARDIGSYVFQSDQNMANSKRCNIEAIKVLRLNNGCGLITWYREYMYQVGWKSEIGVNFLC